MKMAISILMIFRLIKFILDTMIHGYVLYSLYGWSVHILGALWNSLTHLLLHLGRDYEPEKPSESNQPTGHLLRRPPKLHLPVLHKNISWNVNGQKIIQKIILV